MTVRESAGSVENAPDSGVVGRRLAAYVVDAVVLGGLALLVTWRRGRLRRAAWIAGGGGLLYHVLLEGTWGQTLGKRLLGIAVVGADGEPCTYRGAAIRNALRLVDWLPLGYVVGLAAIGLSEDRQRVGDIAADTRVVRTVRDTVVEADHREPGDTRRAATT